MRPGTDLGDDRRRLLGPEGGSEPQGLGVARLVHGPVHPGTRPLGGVELPDEGEHLPARGRVVRLRLHELPADMRPAVRQGEPGPGPRQGVVGPVPVGEHNAPVAVEHLPGRLLRAALQDRVGDGIGAGHAPGPPSLARAALHEPPPRLVGPDDRSGQYMLVQSLVGRLQHRGEGLDLIPERLGRDVQPLAPHHPGLALQRQVIAVLADRDLDRELRSVAPAAHVGAGREAQRSWRGVHTPVARTPVLLALVGDEHEPPLDDGDLVRVFRLPSHRPEHAAALGARLIGGVEHVHHLDMGQLGLGLRAVATPGRRGGSRLGIRPARALLRGRTEEGLLALREQLLQECQLTLGGGGLVAAEPGELVGEGGDLRVEFLVLALEEDRDLTKHVSIADRLEAEHERTTSSRRA